MGLEVEFDSRVLYENEDSYYSRLESYINAFETNNVFKNSAIAYYSGTKGILDMYHSNSIENTLILDRIANHILKRRSQSVGIEIANDPKTDVIVAGGVGELRIEGIAEFLKTLFVSKALM